MDGLYRLEENLRDSIDLTPDTVVNSLNLKWKYSVPASRANKLAVMIGKPNNGSSSIGGYAEWRDVDALLGAGNTNGEGLYSKLVIKDEEIPHLVPGLHKDFFYAYIKLPIPADKISTVLELSESISYDSLKHELCARCHLMLPNLVSLFMSKQIAFGDKNLAHAQQEYGILIKTMEDIMINKGIGIDLGKPGRLDISLINYLFDLELDVTNYPK